MGLKTRQKSRDRWRDGATEEIKPASSGMNPPSSGSVISEPLLPLEEALTLRPGPNFTLKDKY